MEEQPRWFSLWLKFLEKQNEKSRITKKDVEYLMKNRPSISDLTYLLRSKKKPKKKRLKSRSKKKK